MEKLSSVFVGILMGVITLVSPELRGIIDNFVNDLNVRARATKSPYDDVAVKLLAGILGVTLK